MRNRFARLIVAVGAVFASTPVLLAQTTAQSGAAVAAPDLSGIWARSGGGGRYVQESPPPLQPWAMEIYQRNRAGLAPNEQGWDHLDPSTFCFPRGLTRAMGDPFQLIQFPDRIVMIFEGLTPNRVRKIYMDGRGHPQDWPFRWMGHSVGKWEGNTLLVDTVGLNGKPWIDNSGVPYSDALHIVERFQRLNQNAMEIEFQLEDSKAFTKPVTTKKTYQLRPDMELMDLIVCEDHLQIGKYWMHDPVNR